MKYISFTLTMPNRNTWNGKWTGDQKLYARIIKVSDKSFEKFNYKNIINKDLYYDFGDGWVASVKIETVDLIKAKQIKKTSSGFCGYDWMICSILRKGNIEYEKNWQMPFYF